MANIIDRLKSLLGGGAKGGGSSVFAAPAPLADTGNTRTKPRTAKPRTAVKGVVSGKVKAPAKTAAKPGVGAAKPAPPVNKPAARKAPVKSKN